MGHSYCSKGSTLVCQSGFFLFAFFLLFSLNLNAQTVHIDQWNDNSNSCEICWDEYSSTVFSAYQTGSGTKDTAPFTDPIGNTGELITSVTVTFNVAACDYEESTTYSSTDQIALAYPIEINGHELGTWDPTELPCICGVCEDGATKTVTFDVDPGSLPYNYGGENVIDLNFYEYSTNNGGLQHVCVGNIDLEFTTENTPCTEEITGVYLYDQSTDAPVEGIGALFDGATISPDDLPAGYYITVETTSGVQSVQIELNGSTQSTENVVPYTWPNGADGGSNWNGGAGTWTVNASAYSQDNAAGGVCDDIELTFTIDAPNSIEICDLSGYQSANGRVFWLPPYGTDFKASGTGLFFEKFDNGTAHLYGTVQRISDSNKKFEVSIHWTNESTYDEWIAQGGEPKDPQLGDETTWTFYELNEAYENTLVGLGSLSGVVLNIHPQNNNYGLQIGNGANALNTNPNGFSTWFDYSGSANGSGDINATITCSDCNETILTYEGQCDDPSDSFYPSYSADCVINATNLYPAQGAGTASCNDDIICLQSTLNNWVFEFEAGAFTTVRSLVADFLYPINLGTAGGPMNDSNCPESIDYHIEFYKNDALVETLYGDVQSDMLVTEYLLLSNPIELVTNDLLRVEIYGDPVSSDCGLFEVESVDVKGCCGTFVCTLEGEGSVTDNSSCAGVIPNDVQCDCEGKMRNFTVIYQGPSGVDINAWDSANHDNLITSFSNVQNGQILYVSAEGVLGNDEFESKTFLEIAGGSEYEIHTSCSQDILGLTIGDFLVIAFTDGAYNECNPQYCNGAIDLTITSGLAPYTYSWSNGASTEDVFGLCDGNYTVTVTDAAGCSIDLSFEVGVADFVIEASATTSDNSTCVGVLPEDVVCECNGKMRNFTVVYQGPSGVDINAWDSENHDNLITTFTNVQNGQVLYVTAEGILGNDEFESKTFLEIAGGAEYEVHTSCSQDILGLTIGDFLVIGFTDGDYNECNPQYCNGSIDLTVTEGEGPFTFAWSNGATTEDLTAVCDGDYTVIITNANGCSIEQTYTVNQAPIDIAAEANICDANVCDGPCNEYCFENVENPDVVNANSEWVIDEEAGTLTIRTAMSRTFVDNTYGTNTVGWDGSHSFNSLVGSDKMQIALYDADGNVGVEIVMDYISADDTAPSGYSSLGVTGGSGDVVQGNPDHVLHVTSSLSENLNTYGYVLLENSPATDANYTPNPAYPNWIWDVWYEATIDLAAFGTAGFGYPSLPEVHASPSKTGNNSESVESLGCCGYGCNGAIDLTVTSGTGPFTYAWSNGDTTEDLSNVCPGVYTVTVTDANGCSASFDFEVICQPACTITCPADITVSCEIGTDPSATGEPVLTDCADPNSVDVTYSDVSTGSCPEIIERTWTINAGSCAGDQQTVCVQLITVTDEVAPELQNVPADLDLSCVDELPLPADVTALDNCDPNVEVQFEETNLDFGSTTTCQIADGDNHTMWFGDALNDLPSTTDKDFMSVGNGTFEAFADGTAHFYGTVANQDNPNQIFDYDLWLTNKSTFEEWTAIPNASSPTGFRQEKLDAGTTVEITDQYLDWDYYELDVNQSNTLIGQGDYAGINLDITPNPADFQFGVQVGDRASLQSLGHGLSMWMMINGDVNGSSIISNGDFNFALNGCVTETPEITCEDSYTITRTWTAQDECGNMTSATQTITVSGDTEAPTLVGLPDDGAGYTCNNLPSADDFAVTAEDNCGNATLSSTESVNGDECSGTKTITWTAVDDCGNETTATRTFSYADVESPVLTSAEPQDLSLGCGSATPDVPTLTFEDVCDADVEVSFNEVVTEFDDRTEILRTWVAVDNCGNETSVDQLITIEACAALGDFVWFDEDRDGIQDPGEGGVEGVTVTLYLCDGTELTSTTTDANGMYLFEDLEPNQEYYVVFSNLPADYVFSDANQGGDEGLDSDADSTGQTACVELGPGETNLDLDAGINLPTAALGDFVWNDEDGDGVQDPGEPGVEGITVTLYLCDGTELTSTTTDANGMYLFEDLEPNQEYYVVFSDLPADYVFSDANQGGDEGLDSDADSTGQTACVELGPGETNLDLDAGINLPTAALGDFVWFDEDRDGIQDPGEGGVEGVTVTLYLCDGTELTSTTTDANGMYLFEDLEPNQEYYVVFSNLPADYVFSDANQGGDEGLDSDADSTGQTACVELGPGETNLDLDAGINLPTAALGDFVWNDEDGDGVQDPGEPGVEGITVTLYLCDGTELTSTTTDANGMYLFEDLEPNQEYYVVFSNLPADYVFSDANQGGDEGLDSDADSTGQTACVELGPGETNLDLDAGINLPTAALGDFVWFDEDRDGIQDPGEGGVEGVTVTLYLCDGTELTSTTTDANGMYLFEDLEPNQEYYVVFSNLPADYVFSDANQGGDEGLDSDADSTGQTACVELGPGETNLDLDAGINLPTAALGDFVWFDEDRDGIQDPGEGGVEGVTVTLYLCDGTELTSTTTDANGMYLFEDLEPNQEYYVVFSNLPADYVFSDANQGGDEGLDSDADSTGQTACVELGPGETNLDLDAGINLPTAALGDFVWFDEDRDGIQDPGEGGVEGVTVTLYLCDGTELTSTTTDANGMYLFEDLEPNQEYYVVFSNLPADYVFSDANQGGDEGLDSDADSTGQTACVELGPGETNLDLDAGINLPTAALGDFVWFDEDRDGIQDPGEGGVEGVTVTLYLCDGTELTSTTTDANGMYLFEDLEPNQEYYVVFSNLPADYVFSDANQGGDEGLDSDADSTGQTACVELGPGETNLDLDAGINNPLATLGDYVWEDLDYDGVQDPDEPGVEGITVTLYLCDGTELTSTTTDANGMYLFEDLEPNQEYYVVFSDLPADFVFTNADQGGDDSLDSDANNSGQTPCVLLEPGDEYLDLDGGVVTCPVPMLEGPAPQDISVSCDETIPAPATLIFSDPLYGEASVVYSEEEIALDCLYKIERTWTATNECGQSATVTQTVTIIDDEAPIIVSAPADVTIECDQPEPTDMPEFSDNCDSVLDMTAVSGIVQLDCGYEIQRTWTATDDCGNSTSVSQTITVLDTTDPEVVSAPADVTISCLDSEPTDAPEFTDNCDADLQVEMVSSIIEQDCGYIIQKTWTATDDCGNSTSVTQNITVIDDQAPYITFATPDMTISCEDEIPEIEVIFVDDCDNQLTVVVENDVNIFECGYEVVKTCTATDDCGNSVSTTTVITVIDEVPPVAENVPADVTIDCEAEVPTDAPTFYDTCDELCDIDASSVINILDCGYEIVKTWVATDDCGNFTTVTQTITVTDTTAPVITCPVDYVVNCDNGSSDPDFAGYATATDNCSDFTITFVDGIVSEDCPATFERTWTATDDCGNASSCVQLITINDFAAPVITCPADVTIECTDSTSPDNTGMATAIDDCSVPSVSYVDGPTLGDCPYTIERTWTAMDPCGNSSSCVQIITIIDTVAPVLSGEDAIVELECNVSPTIIAPTAEDNCDEDVEIIPSVNVIPGDCPNNYTEVYTWTAIDDCGNTSVRTLTFIFDDTQAPVLSALPGDITVECDAIPDPATLTATDNCSENVEVSFSQVSTGADCGGVLQNIWTAIDECGNTVSHTQWVTIVDTTDPIVLTAPQDVTIECDQPEPVEVPTFSDNCDEDLEILAISGITNVTDCGYQIERVWTAIDDCDNAVSVTQIITVIDTTAPVISGVPADTTVDCEQIPSPAVVTAEDNCDDLVVPVLTETMTNGCPYQIIRTWTATDICGNMSSETQVITVVDNTAPILVGVPDDINEDCGDTPDIPVVTAEDNCDADVPVVFSQEVIGEACPLTVIRTWTATDDCGNTVSASQTIVIDDETAPVFVGVPADATVECDNVPDPANDEVVVSDNCDINPVITYNEVIEPGDPVIVGGLPCGYTIYRTWTATDLCGNASSHTQVVVVVDTTAPVIVGVPADATVECDDIPAAAQVSAVDNCFEGPMSVTLVETVIPGQGCEYQIQRTWSAADNCNNIGSATQILTVVDTTDPVVLTTPADVTIECDEDMPTDIPTFDDNCDDDLTIVLNETPVALDCGYYVLKEWTATDDCGNSVTATQTVTVTDTTDPVLVGVPADAEVECSAIPAPATPSATDNCDINVAITFNEVIGVGECPYTITRTWTATDDCGNTSSQSQVLTVLDTTAPILIGVPADAVVECDNVPAPAVVTVSDNCDADIQVTFNTVSEANECGYTIYRTWSAIDNCQNAVSATQEITVVDTTDPVIVVDVQDVAVDCDEALPTDEPSFDDNCDEQLNVQLSEVVTPGNCPNNYTITRTWTATDNCGNATSTTQVITVSDTEAPVLIGVPANAVVECDAIPAPAVVSATDNCDDVNVEFAESSVEDGCNTIITRTWTATDGCLNTTSLSQTLTVVDTTAPTVVSTPAAVTIECSEELPTDVAVFTDNCDENLTVTSVDETLQAGCTAIIERTWTATDDCGNSISTSQLITIVDTTAPVLLNLPDDETVECDAIPAPAVVEAVDNCDNNVTVFYNEEIVSDGCPYTLERTWDVSDDCGNFASYTQTITIVDNTPPVLIGVPADATVECDAIPAPAVVTAEDNCSNLLTVTYGELTEDLDCGAIITRTWSTVDDCGNITTDQQILTVVDTTDPIVVSAPADVTIECDQAEPTDMPVFDDNCDNDLALTVTSGIVQLDCGYEIQKTWTATDDCGNSVSVSQTITVTDTTVPEIVSGPEDITVECDAIPGPGNITAVDNCDELLDYNVSDEVEGEGCLYTILRTFTATDDCGNTSSYVQVITVQDTTAPEILTIPDGAVVECGDAIPAPVTLVIEDNCDPNPTVSVSESTTVLECGYELLRTYTATDICGNTSSVAQLFLVVDTTAPVIEGVPADITVECDNIPVAPVLSATDICDDNVSVTMNEVISDGCPYTIVRTWTATDDCGNESSVSQTITVDDTVAPEFDEYPAFLQLSCELVDDYMITATDNCNVTVTIIEELAFSGGCLGSVQRTYKAEDDCGNFVTAVQLIQIIDETDPEIFNIPADIELSCGEEIPEPATDIFGTDNCTVDVEITFTEEQTNEFCPYEIIRTWTAMDNCGNVTEGVQVISVTNPGINAVNLFSYPNPFNDRFHVEFQVPFGAEVTAKVYDIVGKEVLEIFNGEVDAQRLYEYDYNGLNWEAGTYVIMMTVNNDVYYHKMIVTQR